jgi:hypothetical protein
VKALPTDDRKSWVVAFTALEPQAMPVEDGYLAFSIPLLLKDHVSALRSHVFPAEERIAYQKLMVRNEQQGLYQNLAQLRQQRDEFLFTPPANSQALDNVRQRLQAALDRADWLESLDPGQVDLVDEKPVVFKEGTGVGNLFNAPAYSPREYATQKDVDADLLIGGSVKVVQGYILYDLWAYEPSMESIVYTFRDAAQPEQVYASLTEAAQGLIGIILGRDWSALSIQPDPPQSTVFIDGVSMGEGKVQSAYLKPGEREIRVASPGYKEETRAVTLASREVQTVSIALEKEAAPNITLFSDPPGSDIYVDSVWQGKTPLSLELPPVRSRVQLDRTGFYDLPFSIGPGSVSDVSLSLQRDVGSRADLQKIARNDFYGSFGFFALSLPLPIFLYSLSLDYGALYNTFLPPGSPSETGVYVGGYALYFSSLAGAALSASLFTWAIINLVHYITVSTRTAG